MLVSLGPNQTGAKNMETNLSTCQTPTPPGLQTVCNLSRLDTEFIFWWYRVTPGIHRVSLALA